MTILQNAEVTYPHADVAQLVEQLFRKPQVIGSSPIVGSASHTREISACS